MAAWPPNNQQKKNSMVLKKNDMFIGALLSQRPGIELMQNCDLPPPAKVFSGLDKMVISSMNRLFGMMGRRDDDDDCFDAFGSGGGKNEKLELLKALRLSQTRAREAERKATSLVKERDSVSNALLQQSFQLRAYRQWVWLLELQVLKLQSEWKLLQEKEFCCSCGRAKGKDSGDGNGASLLLALAFCLGIASVGLAFGCSYLF